MKQVTGSCYDDTGADARLPVKMFGRCVRGSSRFLLHRTNGLVRWSLVQLFYKSVVRCDLCRMHSPIVLGR